MKFVAAMLLVLSACGRSTQGVDVAAAPEATTAAASEVTAAAPEVTAPAQAADVIADVPAPAARGPERWSATLVLDSENRDLVLAFAPSGPAWSGKMTVPRFDKTFDLVAVEVTADHLHFGLGTREVYDLARTGDAASGTATIGGTPYLIKMARLAADAAPHAVKVRPQTPEPPFPYAEREVVVDAPGGAKLAGTLTVPEAPGGGTAPAILLWSGSGQQDRNETVYGHQSFLILADRLTRAGFVVLRLDDRGTGKTVGPLGTLWTEIDDASAAVAFLAGQREVDPKRLGMLGHSTGGMVLAHVAAKTQRLAFLVSLAGVALTGAELVPLQLEFSGKLSGAPPDALAAAIALQRKIGAAVAKGADAVHAVLAEAAGAAIAAQLGRAATPAEIEQAIAPQLAATKEPWTVSYFTLDPRAAWGTVTAPVLFVGGDKDSQVPADVMIKALEEALPPAAKARLTTHILPGLNHLFQHAQTGLPAEYKTIDETFDPAALELITTWLREQAGLP